MSEKLPTTFRVGITVTLAELDALLKDMDKDTREIIACYISGYTMEEIAAEKRMTIDTVQATISNAVGQIKQSEHIVTE